MAVAGRNRQEMPATLMFGISLNIRPSATAGELGESLYRSLYLFGMSITSTIDEGRIDPLRSAQQSN